MLLDKILHRLLSNEHNVQCYGISTNKKFSKNKRMGYLIFDLIFLTPATI